jgi:hypothetical protein
MKIVSAFDLVSIKIKSDDPVGAPFDYHIQ